MTGSKTQRRKLRSGWRPCSPTCPVCKRPDARPIRAARRTNRTLTMADAAEGIIDWLFR